MTAASARTYKSTNIYSFRVKKLGGKKHRKAVCQNPVLTSHHKLSVRAHVTNLSECNWVLTGSNAACSSHSTQPVVSVTWNLLVVFERLVKCRWGFVHTAPNSGISFHYFSDLIIRTDCLHRHFACNENCFCPYISVCPKEHWTPLTSMYGQK